MRGRPGIRWLLCLTTPTRASYRLRVLREGRSIEGVDTDVAGFVGVTDYGPTAPTLVTSWPGSSRRRSAASSIGRHSTPPDRRLPDAVRGFFENGGRRSLHRPRARRDGPPGRAGDLRAMIGDETNPEAPTGVTGLMGMADVTLLAAPDDVVVTGLTDALIDRCEDGPRLDRNRQRQPPAATDSSEAMARHRDTSFGALYYPRLRAPAHPSPGFAVVPPCGHVAGVLANHPFGCSQHPPLLADVFAQDHPSGLGPLDRQVSAADAEWLTPRGVNVIRDFRDCGRACGSGARGRCPRTRSGSTSTSAASSSSSSSRSTADCSGWSSSPTTRRPGWRCGPRSRTSCSPQWRDGALVGSTPDDAFFVKCDRSHDDPGRHRQRPSRLPVGVAPLRPAEFVVLRICQKTANRPDDP